MTLSVCLSTCTLQHANIPPAGGLFGNKHKIIQCIKLTNLLPNIPTNTVFPQHATGSARLYSLLTLLFWSLFPIADSTPSLWSLVGHLWASILHQPPTQVFHFPKINKTNLQWLFQMSNMSITKTFLDFNMDRLSTTKQLWRVSRWLFLVIHRPSQTWQDAAWTTAPHLCYTHWTCVLLNVSHPTFLTGNSSVRI